MILIIPIILYSFEKKIDTNFKVYISSSFNVQILQQSLNHLRVSFLTTVVQCFRNAGMQKAHVKENEIDNSMA